MAIFVQQEILGGGSGANPQSPLSGVIDGSNKVYTFNSPVNNLFLNEGFQTPNIDYTSSTSGGIVTVTFTVAPVPNSTIYAT